MNKSDVLKKIIEAQAAKLEGQRRAAEDAFHGATDSEVQSESKYDTRGLESSYLARGHAMQFEALIDDLRVLRAFHPANFSQGRPIALGALALVAAPAAHFAYFILPNSGGLDLTLDWDGKDLELTVITPDTPLARSLMGKKTGDTIVLGSQAAVIGGVW